MRVLLVEDDLQILELLRAYFESQDHAVSVATDGVEGLRQFNETGADLILLDIGLPELDGWGVLEAIRAKEPVPIVLLTALDDTESVVKGFSMGADDYLSKPFDIRELDARVQAIMRRIEGKDDQASLEVGRIQIDDRSKNVTVGDVSLTLSPKEYALLKLLASDPGRVFSSDEIIARLWPESSRAAPSDVKQYIHLLRSKLDKAAHISDPIENIKGFGYRLVG